MSERDKREMQIEDMIFDLLISMGIAPSLKGFRVLQQCIKEDVFGAGAGSAMELYQSAANKLQEDWRNAARAMRFVIGKAVAAVGIDGVAKRIGSIPCAKGRIEPYSFVRVCARKIRGQIA